MEKLRLANGSEYELVPNGIIDIENGLGIKILMPVDRTLETIRNEFKDPSNTKSIAVVGSEGDTIRIDDGFVVLGNRITVDNHYEVGTAIVDTGDGEFVQERQYDTVVELKLYQENLNSKVDKCREDIDYLMNEVQSVLSN